MSIHPDQFALKAATEITAAAVKNINAVPNAANGEEVAAFFEKIYERALKVSSKNDVE